MSEWKGELDFYNFSDMNVVSEDPGNDSEHSQIIGVKDIREGRTDEQQKMEELNNKLIEEAKKNAELEKHNAIIDAKLDAIQKSVDEFKEKLQSELEGTSDDGSSEGDENEESTESVEFSKLSFSKRLSKIFSNSKNFSIKSDINELKSKMTDLSDVVDKLDELSKEIVSIKSELGDSSSEESEDSIEDTTQELNNTEELEDTTEESDDTSDDGSEDILNESDSESTIDSSLPDTTNFNKKVEKAFNKKYSTAIPKYLVKYSWDEGIDEFIGTLDECNEFIIVNEARVASGEKFEVLEGPTKLENEIPNKVSKFSEFSNRLNKLKF